MKRILYTIAGMLTAATMLAGCDYEEEGVGGADLGDEGVIEEGVEESAEGLQEGGEEIQEGAEEAAEEIQE